ncbi:hypothetical protein G5V59_18740 [Nocardioides sp. W3-2-3]|uniref:hypothetical protein n=1 Tax=Nocardioides convexus TaxID=2712224 RepID=UPI002418B471|nr:hypothetical protein [Nocardioides convexus]NHA01199.1 hypothetical protein [Nocardioides convexus]
MLKAAGARRWGTGARLHRAAHRHPERDRPRAEPATPTGGPRSTRPPPASPSPAEPGLSDPDVIDVGWKAQHPRRRDARRPRRPAGPAAARDRARDPGQP